MLFNKDITVRIVQNDIDNIENTIDIVCELYNEMYENEKDNFGIARDGKNQAIGTLMDCIETLNLIKDTKLIF